MRHRVNRIYFDLFLESFRCVCVILLLLKREPEIIIDVLVVRVQFNLFSKRAARFFELTQAEIRKPEIVPALFALGIKLKRALQKRNGGLEITGIERGEAGFEKFPGFRDFRNFRSTRHRIYGKQYLALVGFHSVSEREVIAYARSGQLTHLKI